MRVMTNHSSICMLSSSQVGLNASSLITLIIDISKKIRTTIVIAHLMHDLYIIWLCMCRRCWSWCQCFFRWKKVTNFMSNEIFMEDFFSPSSLSCQLLFSFIFFPPTFYMCIINSNKRSADIIEIKHERIFFLIEHCWINYHA